MTIAYQVREVSLTSVTIDFATGSWAIVPIESGMSKESIEARIREFAGLRTGFISLTKVPLKAGDSGEIATDQELQAKAIEEDAAKLYNYFELRQRFYPAIGDQLDAAYWARNGKPELLQQIDERITKTKEALPKGMDPITNQQVAVQTAGLHFDAGFAATGMSMEQLIEQLES